MDRWNSVLKQLVAESERRREGGRSCLVSAAAGLLDNTPMMAIGYYKHYSNCGDVRGPKKSRPAC